MLTLCTTGFNIQKFFVLPTVHLSVGVDLITNSDFFSLYRINLSVFITEVESVYCAVRTGPSNQTDTFSPLMGEDTFQETTKFHV